MKRHISFSTQIARSVKILLFMLLCGINVFGQTATPNAVINFPSHICSGQATTLNLNNSIQVNNPKFSLYHHATTIIPNGNCPNGCNFDDIFQFSSFRPTDTIRSTEDINFVLLNMEHSYIGELLIEVICPNQQSATLLRYNRFEISNDCESTINNSNSGWQGGHNNCFSGDFLGYPYTNADATHPCETFGNGQNDPGEGWSYCWSNHSRYNYAPYDGLIYRVENEVALGNYQYSVHESDTLTGSYYYHPDQSFSALIGCPMNGTWHVRVMDGHNNGDNGYVFLSALSLQPDSALADSCFIVDSIGLCGPWVNNSQAPNYTITPPSTLAHDSLAAYTITFYNTEGEQYDTTVYVLVQSPIYQYENLTICESELPYDFYGNDIPEGTESCTLAFHDIASTGCDSTTILNLTVIPMVYTFLYDTICAGERYMDNGFNIMTYHEGTFMDYRQEVSWATGCDSIVIMELTALSLPYLSITKEQNFCHDTIATLTAWPEGMTYHWSNGANTQSITVPTPGTYFITATASNGCSTQDSITLSDALSPYYAFNLPTDLCSGVDYNFTLGFESENSIVLGSRNASLGYADTTFLPDGVECEPQGCSYRSPVTFTDFPVNATIQDVNDILFVRLNMEHSFIGDLYISITCPNGQRADILKYCGTGASSCTNSISYESVGWHNGTNANTYFLGLAYDLEDTLNPCDPTQPNNQPGIGWNYCWSNNTAAGYTYAPCDGSYIYRASNAHRRLTPDGSQRWVFDSTNVAQGSNFFHPDQPFTSLIGCPLNGSWTIEVQDGWRKDNGYIFEWELALSPELLSDESFAYDSFTIQGPWATVVDSATFHILPPESLDHDTLVQYLVTVFDESGCSYDTVLTFLIHPSYNIVVYDTIQEQQLPYDILGFHFIEEGSQTQLLQNVNGCDSSLTCHLAVLRKFNRELDTILCSNTLPFLWRDRIITEAGIYHDTVLSSAPTAIDSFFTLQLTLNDPQHTTIEDTICLGGHYTQNGFNITPTEVGTYHYNINTNSIVTGCDSTIDLTLTVVESMPFSIVSHHLSCDEEMVALSIEPAGESYLWSNGATTQAVSVPSPGSYSVTVSDANGCSTTLTQELVYHESPFSGYNIPDLCAGNSYVLNIDFDEEASVVLHHGNSSLAVSDTIFLPDGISCEPYGCSYRSPVTFTDFTPNATIQTVNDIYYLRLNIEHSYIGDLYINITCPNGQKADILKFAGTGSSSCTHNIPSSSRGWNTSGTNSSHIDFGIPYANNDSQYKCDRTRPQNRPGTGWNYCWSNNTNQGYAYASVPGSYVYRSANVTTGSSIDSSNVALGTQFYHPDQSFSNLIGCPMNGSWYIEVIDGFSVDNGYIFGWELALSPELLPQDAFVMDTFNIEGPWVTGIDSNTFGINPPITLTHDTLVTYTIILYDTNGCVYDSTFDVMIYVPRHTTLYDTICLGHSYHANGFNVSPDSVGAFTFEQTLLSLQTQCDSVVTLQLTVLAPHTNIDTIVTYDSYTWHGVTYTESNNTAIFSTNDINGCDSIVLLNLTILYSNDTTRIDTFVCGNNIPLNLYGTLVYNDSVVYRILPRSNGSDSVIITNIRVIANPISTLSIPDELCAGDTLSLSTGHSEGSHIQLLQPINTHTDTRRVFIPDGMSCEPYGTHYRSYATFNHFNEGSTMSNANDLLYLRLKIEHSAIEDIRISLTCPNGQSCRIVPDYQYDTWGDDTTFFHRLNFGLANRLSEVSSCDSSLNPIGKPWNYIWSSCNNQGYQYAGGDHSFVFEEENVHFRNNPYWDAGSVSYVVDSSDMATMSHIYHPSQSFDSLIGCPLNGSWYIQVEDLWEYDNGYLVEWELAFTPTLTRQQISQVSSRTIAGPWAVASTDTTFLITPPVTIAHDSTGNYIFNISDSLGCTFDTTFSITVHPVSVTHLYDTICASALPYNWNTLTFSEAGTQARILSNKNGCDSTIYHHLTVVTMPTLTVSNDVVLHAGGSATLSASGVQQYQWSPSTGLNVTVGSTVTATPTASTYYVVTGSNVNGSTSCSAIDTIQVLVYVPKDTTLCENDLPLVWYGETFTSAGTRDIVIVNPSTLDDAFTLQVHVNLNTTATINLSIVENQLPFDTLGLHFSAAGSQQLTLTNANGCDSTVTVNLTVRLNTATTIDTVICQNETPFQWIDGSLSESGTYTSTLTNSLGADSVVTLNLTVNPTYVIEENLEICRYDLPYLYEPANHTFPVGTEEQSTFTYTLPTINGCDSIINLNVIVHSTHIEIISNDNDFCTEMTATLEVNTDMQNYVWSTGETSPTITVEMAGNYAVTGTSGPCTAVAQYAITQCELTLQLPNAITPNGDGLNDYLSIDERFFGQLGDEFEIVIFNRWGEVVFSSRDKHFKWYGEVRGTVLHNTMYNYMIRYTNIFDRPLIYKGSLLVM